MKHAIVTLAALAIAGHASAQQTQLNWSAIPTPTGSAAAWALKPAANASAKPQLIVVMRTATPDASPAMEKRISQKFAIDVDCAAGKVHPAAEISYDEAFKQTGSKQVEDVWVDYSQLGNLGELARFACAQPNPALLWKADEQTAHVKLDQSIPKPKIPPRPPATSTFEYVGASSTSYQPIQYWVDTASITREGDLAKAWAVEVWPNSWGAIPPSYAPITWRLYEFKCDQRPSVRNIWFQEVGIDLKLGSNSDQANAKFSVAGDVNDKAMALRVCNKRPLLFSEIIAGDLKTLISKRYVGASQKLSSGIPYSPPPAAQPVDLGPTIRITEKDQYWTYNGVFKRQGESQTYSGKFEAEGIDNPNPGALFVRGIVDGKLIIERGGKPEGQFAIPVANGKTTGKGVASWSRADDTYSWTLVEPKTFTLK